MSTKTVSTDTSSNDTSSNDTSSNDTSSNDTSSTDAFRPFTSRKGSLRRRLGVVSIALVASLGGLATTSQPAHASGTDKYCTHGWGVTNIYVGFPYQYQTGIVIDSYVQRYNGYSWVFTSLSQRAYSTRDGFWMTASGRYVDSVSFNVTANTGFYRIMNHIYYASSPNSTPYVWVAGYMDNLRGWTSWCQS